MKNIYVSGIAGLVGSNVAKNLISKGYNVKGCDNLIGGYESNIPENCEWANIDILDLNNLSDHMKDCDTIIHCAALAYEGLSVFSPKLVTENIYTGSISVMTAAIKNGLTKFINCSSMARYGNQKPPFTEKMKTNPVDPYGMAKAQAEQALNLLSEIHGVKIYTVVPHNIIGVGQRYDDPFRNVIAIFINRLLQGKSVYVYGDGQQKRSISYIQDCVNPITQLIEDDKFNTGIVFNIGPDDNEMTIEDLVKLVGFHCDIKPEINFIDPRPCEVKNAWCSSNKAKETLNYNPITSLDEGMKIMIQWIRDRGTLPFNYDLPIEIINERTPKTWTNKLI